MSNAQITLFGYSTDSRTNDEPAAHSGGYAHVRDDPHASLSVR
jgi:hypothetical protein